MSGETNDVETVSVGKVVKPHGVQGELVVEPLTDFVEKRFAPGNQLLVDGVPGTRTLTVENVRWHQERLLLDTRELNDCEEAESLRGAELAVDRQSVFDLPEEEFYGFELLGLEVYNQDGEPVGKISRIWEAGEQYGFEIESEAHGTIDFPARPELIVEINREEDRVTLDFPRGWQNLIRE